MVTDLRRRFWVEIALASLTAGIAILTTIWPNWFEALSGSDPDNGDGSFEWVITLSLALTAVAMAVIARWEWRRQRLAS